MAAGRRSAGVIQNALALSHQYMRAVIQPGDLAVDATAGNGGDTLFLAGLAGPAGHVFAFDIQQTAIERTAARIREADLGDQVTLFHLGHEHLADQIIGYQDQHDAGPETELEGWTDGTCRPILKGVMFNLGYLPGADHAINTRPETTCAAIRQACDLLLPGGIVTIGLYYGGDSGFAEKEIIPAFMRTLPVRNYAVQQIEMINAENCPPIFICIEKLS